jgi:hypothetical protein
MSVAANARAFKTATVRRERRLIVIRPEYLEIGGDISVAALLSQIVYWSEPDHTGRTKLRVQRDGVYWIAKARDEWMHETGLTMEQYKRAVSVLKRRGLIEVRVMRFNGLAIGHTRLIADALQEALLGGKATNRVVGNPPTGWGVSHQPFVTETTTQTTYNKNGACRSKVSTITGGRQRPNGRLRERTARNDPPREAQDREDATTSPLTPTQQADRQPALATTMSFGKHIGKPLTDLPDSYLDWLLGTEGPDHVAEPLRRAMNAEDKRRSRSRHGHIPNAEETAAYLCNLGGYASVAEMHRLHAIERWAASQPDMRRRKHEDDDTWRNRMSTAHRQAHEQVA